MAPRHQSWPQHRPGGLAGVGPLLFLFGVFLLLMTGNIWPGILWLVGISSFVGAAAAGRSDKALTILVWTAGLALLFAHGTLWPGILLLVFLSMVVNGRGRSSRWWW